MASKNFIRGIVIIGMISSLYTAVFGSVKKGIVSTEEGFVDIDLPIVESKKTPTGLVSVIARGYIRGRVVAFAVDINPSWKRKLTDDKKVAFYWGNGRFRSLGQESDNFVRLLSEMYQRPALHASMQARIEVEAVGLNNGPPDVFKAPTKMKLFFKPYSTKEYAEVYLNLDIPAKKLEFHEKDPEYREPLLHVFGARF